MTSQPVAGDGDDDGNGREGRIAFRQGRLYMQYTRGDKLLRLIVHDELSDVLLFKSVAIKWDKVEKVPFERDRLKALELHRQEKLVEYKECVRPRFLELTDEQLIEQSGKAPAAAQAWLKARDDAYELIRELVEVPENIERRQQALNLRLVLTFSPATHAKTVADHAALKGVKPLVIKRLLHKWVWFGMDKNALLNRDPFKGRIDSFPKKYSTKTGRPNSAMVLGYDKEFEGRNVTAADMRIFREALDKYYVKQDYTLRQTYEKMVEEDYRRKNQHGSFPIRASRVPTWEEFNYHAIRLITLLRLRPEKEGPKDSKDREERRGYDTDISGEVAEVYDVDATPFNKELVCRWKVDGKAINLGKATALVVFDRDSKKAVGWHVYAGAENWKEGYRLALFCALTSKTRHLERLGINDLDAFPDHENIKPSFWYADGGPGSSGQAKAALKRQRIDFKEAPPDAPYWKPTEEGGLGHAQAAQATDAGGYDRRNRPRSKDRKRTAKLFAAETVFDVEKKLVEHLIKYNRKLNKKHLLTEQMREDGVLPSSQSIFSWGVQKMGGVDNRRLSEAEVYISLLEHKENVQVTSNGISLLGSRYQSQRLREMRQRVGSNFPITVLYHPLRMWEAYWVTPEGSLDELERDTRGNRNNGNASAHDIETWALHLAAFNIVAANNKPKRGRISRRQAQQWEELAGVRAPPRKQRDKPTQNEELARKLEAAYEAHHRTYDRPEVHAPDRIRAAPAAAPPPAPVTPPPGPQTQASPIVGTVVPLSQGAGEPSGYSHVAGDAPSSPTRLRSAVIGSPAVAGASPYVRAGTSRMNAAELFARRRQAAVDKRKEDE
jgi:hypothetical protein